MTKRRRTDKKGLKVVLFLLLVVVAGVICYLVWNSYFRDEKEPEQVDDITVLADEGRKEAEEEVSEPSPEKQDEEDSETEDEKKVVQYEGDDPNENSALTGVITYADVDDGKMVIRVNIDQYLADGVCKLALRQGDDIIYSDETRVIDLAATSTCEGFDVILADGVSGRLEIDIELLADSKSGLISGEIEI